MYTKLEQTVEQHLLDLGFLPPQPKKDEVKPMDYSTIPAYDEETKEYLF